MPYYFTPTVTRHDDGEFFEDSLRVARSRYAIRTVFRPICIASAGVDSNGEANPPTVVEGAGIYAEISVPESSDISSFAVSLLGTEPEGTMYLSTVNPQESYDGFFLYTFIENIPPATAGPSMYRKTEIHPGAYNTSVLNERKIYALILDGPKIKTWDGIIKANVAYTAYSA
jgi:hypothetical protein